MKWQDAVRRAAELPSSPGGPALTLEPEVAADIARMGAQDGIEIAAQELADYGRAIAFTPRGDVRRAFVVAKVQAYAEAFLVACRESLS